MSTSVPLPPENLRFMNEDDEKYRRVGDELVDDLRTQAGLTERSVVIDVGSGYGRVAHALIRQGFQGRYRGFDILPRHIAWCIENLTRDNIKFSHLDIKNDRYNPKGELDARSVNLGLGKGSVDVVLATSVFTHMWPDEITNYLAQISRALRSGGRAYLTFFLLNDSWKALDAAGKAKAYPLPHFSPEGNYRYMNPENPLHVIAFSEDWLADQFTVVGLDVEQVCLGQWAGRSDAQRWQDVFIVRKPEQPQSRWRLRKPRLS
jgi:SAM-dependent methyltransferase